MDEALYVSKLDELVEELKTFRPGQKKTLVMMAEKRSGEHLEDKNACKKSALDSLDYMRVSIKYLLFDLEATHRENSYLRSILEEEK